MKTLLFIILTCSLFVNACAHAPRKTYACKNYDIVINTEFGIKIKSVTVCTSEEK